MFLQRWRDAGYGVSVAPLPYDPAVDFVDEAAKAKERLALQRLQMGPVPAQQQQQAAPAKERAAATSIQMLRNAAAAPSNSGGASAVATAAAQRGGRRLLLAH